MSAVQPLYYESLTDVGRERPGNEDAHREYALGDGSTLLVVADGMGGHECGEVASSIAVEAIGQIVQNSPAEDPREKLRNGFLVANQRILAEAERRGAQGMGTTAVAAYVRADQVFVAHVGDSRLYHIRRGGIIQQTVDHTRVQKMVDLGILPPDEAKKHPDANVVTRALGHTKLADGSTLEPEVRTEPLQLCSGDSLVLCTDGLYDDIEDREIAQGVIGKTALEATHALVDLANERGGHDNITVTVLHYGVERGAPPPSGEGPSRETKPYPPPPTSLRSRLLGAAGMLVGVLVLVIAVWRIGPPPAGPSASPHGHTAAVRDMIVAHQDAAPTDGPFAGAGPQRPEGGTTPDGGTRWDGGTGPNQTQKDRPPQETGSACPKWSKKDIVDIQHALGVTVDGDLGKDSCAKLKKAMGQEPWHQWKPQKVLEHLRQNRAAPGGPGRTGGR